MQHLGETMDFQCQDIAMTLSSGKPKAVGNMHVFVPCQIDVVKKQLVSPHSWNNPLTETLLGESNILIICRNADTNACMLREFIKCNFV